MKTKSSVLNWLVIIVVLILFALVASIWNLLPLPESPTLALGGSGPAVPNEVEEFSVDLPPQLGMEPVELNGFTALGLLAVVVIGGVVVVGGVLAFAYTMLSKIVARQANSPGTKASQSALEKREQERIKQMRNGRNPNPMPAHKMPRWSLTSNILIGLMFAAFLALVISGTFYPEGLIEWDNPLTGRVSLIPAGGVIAGLFILITLPFLIWQFKPARVEGIEKTDYGAIPWDFIVVVITFLLVVGLGIGYIVYLNIPA